MIAQQMMFPTTTYHRPWSTGASSARSLTYITSSSARRTQTRIQYIENTEQKCSRKDLFLQIGVKRDHPAPHWKYRMTTRHESCLFCRQQSIIVVENVQVQSRSLETR